ncbi:putative RNApii degradation factor def1 [Rosellinia necatrix]|uniref:RNA polymerase II degradation factor 1 n=1 Tax=Rosellinia necatrix TaxID=77044 RepID=A0A1W2TB57_ROSNE|nr:putative RNApii degradation factor def1 [Rosellinia necatrix]
MAEVQSRTQNSTTRGRGGGRGGRGGFGGRNTSARRANGDKSAAAEPAAFDDDGDIVQLRKQYGEKLGLIKELFADWSDADILYALKETDGDVELTATRIAEGTISQWGEVPKTKKPAPRPKTKSDAPSTGPTESSGNSRPVRGGRSDGSRGRARGNERARGGGRGRGAAHATTNGHRAKDTQLSVPTEEASAWGGVVAPEESQSAEWTNPTSTATDTTDNATPAPVSIPEPAPKPTTTQPAPKTWASMLRQSTAPKPTPKPKEAPAPKPAEVLESLPPAEPLVPEPEPEPQVEETPTPVEAPVEPPVPTETAKIVEPEVALPPPEDDLTKVNLDLLPDESHPPATATAASTTADSWDTRQPAPPSAAVTPLSASQAQHQATRPGASGYATTALKATERPAPRMPSYQRRLLEQEEAVRMPGNREVDRAAVQFGAFNLNGGEEDIDGDREDPETRTQPPAESPAAPRASLPPISQPASVPDSFPSAQKPAISQAPPQAPAAATPVAPPTGPASSTAQPPQVPSSNPAYGRFPQPSSHEAAAGFPQKPYDTFTQQPATTASYDGFPATTTQAPGPQTSGAFTSGPNDYSSYYTADQQSRNSYGAYYGYGQQQGGQNHGEPNATSRQFGAYNASQSDNLSQYPQSGAQQSRYPGAASTDAHNSGHNTPNPVGQNQQQASGQATQPQSNIHQQQPSYPYQHPYYTSPYYAQYINQPYTGYGQGGYAGAPYGKGGIYGQGHQYGMSPQAPFDHASTAGTAGFGQSSVGSRETGLTSGINDFGRSGTAQQSGAPGALGSASGFGGVHDSYGRGTGFPSQGGQAFNAANAPTATPGSGNDDLKPYGDSKTGGGPSPSLAAAARPGSTTNATPAASGLPPPQSNQQSMGGYGGYPSHLTQGLHGGQTAGSGYGLGASSSQGHGNTPYGGYGNQGFGSYYGGRQGHQGGWGGNYH